jgi:hypothetical protein
MKLLDVDIETISTADRDLSDRTQLTRENAPSSCSAGFRSSCGEIRGRHNVISILNANTGRELVKGPLLIAQHMWSRLCNQLPLPKLIDPCA